MININFPKFVATRKKKKKFKRQLMMFKFLQTKKSENN